MAFTPAQYDLVARIGGDIADLQKTMSLGRREMAQTEGAISKNLATIDKLVGGFSVQLGKVGSVIEGNWKTILGGTVAGGVIAGLVDQTKKALELADAIAKASTASGLSTQQYQELAYATARAGVEANETAKATEAFARSAFEARNGVGKLYELLMQINPEAAAALRATTNNADALRIFADAAKGAANETQRAQIATAAFGASSAEMTRFLRSGSDGIEAAAAKARDLGAILDEEVIRSAGKVKEDFEAVSNVLSVTFQGAMIRLAPSLIGVAKGLSSLSPIVIDVADAFSRAAVNAGLFYEIASRSIPKLSIAALEEQAFQATYQLAGVNAQIAKLTASGDVSITASMTLNKLREDAARLNQTLAATNAELEKRSLSPNPGAIVPNAPPKFDLPVDTQKSARERAIADLDAIEKRMLETTKQTSALIQFEYDEQLRKLQANLDAGLISQEQFEAARVNLAQIATRKYADLAQTQMKSVTDALSSVSSNLGTAFDSFIDGTEVNFQELTRSILADIAKIAIRAAILQPLFGGGTTPGATGGSGLLAGLFHEGGVVGAGGGKTRFAHPDMFAGAPRYHSGGVAGLKPGELPAILERGEIVLPKGSGLGGGSSQTVNIINNSGGEAREERRRTSSGAEIIDVIISRVKDDMSRGKFDGPMSGRFGVKPNTRGT